MFLFSLWVSFLCFCLFVCLFSGTSGSSSVTVFASWFSNAGVHLSRHVTIMVTVLTQLNSVVCSVV
ncbi:hypothetical protein EX30DRAFT_342896 [Ascodesmis nigricans]|uniref:Secreted protein n=1 Tax=Ascodesmis nigricans TaxID=341454 RepID=A0A4S2MRS0_9PEZI|nr:hypothetical protein EX30DRAFT_342896 [Ascodesmis nigricans]